MEEMDEGDERIKGIGFQRLISIEVVVRRVSSCGGGGLKGEAPLPPPPPK